MLLSAISKSQIKIKLSVSFNELFKALAFVESKSSCWFGGLYKPTINYYLTLKLITKTMHSISSSICRFTFSQGIFSYI